MNNTIIVNENNKDLRLDNFLIKLFPTLKRNTILEFIRKRKVRVNGKRIIDNGYRLKIGDTIKYYFFVSQPKSNAPYNVPPLGEKQIFYEDENFLVVYKHYNTIMHSHKFSLNEKVYKYLFLKNEIVQDFAFKVHHIHRIDRETKGLVIYAKNRKAQVYLYDQFYTNKVIKGYYALIKKTNKYSFNKWSELKGNLVYNQGYFDKLVINSCKQSKFARIKVKKVEEVKNNLYVLLKIICFTGRKHQIRILLNHSKTPIVNDQKYGFSKSDNLLLFSYLLEFKNTKNNTFKQYKFEVSKKEVLKQIFEIMGWKS